MPTETITPEPTGTETLTVTPTATITATPSSPSEISLEGDDVEAEVDENGATLVAFKGQVKVHFPKDAAREKLKVKIRKVDPSEVPDTLLGDSPFEVVARRLKDDKEVKEFKEKLTIDINYDLSHMGGISEESLRLFYFDEGEMAWMPLPSAVDLKNHTIHGRSDHLTVFDFDVESWDPSFLPSTKESQTSSFTGGATYNYPIELPPFPGDNPLALSLNYSSQVVDEMTINSQASFVGAGWSFDTGYVVRNFGAGLDNLIDDTYMLNLNGASHQLWVAADGYYHTEDESFIRVYYTGGYYYALDKSGNKYFFDHKALKAYWWLDSSGRCQSSTIGWKYSLTKIQTPSGNTVNISYDKSSHIWNNHCTSGTDYSVDSDVRPTAIEYYFAAETVNVRPSRYRVEFEYTHRYDYLKSWIDANSRSSASEYKLSAINIKHDIDGVKDGGGKYSYDETIRRYELYYSGDNLPDGSVRSDYIFPSHTWDAGNRTLTLVKIRQVGHQEAGQALPPVDFYYEDGMHLTKVTNGYGAETTFKYEPWTDVASNNGRSWWDYIGMNPSYSCGDADAPATMWDGAVGCGGTSYMNITGKAIHALPGGLIRPGGVYRFVGDFPIGSNYPKFSLSVNGVYTDTDRVKIDSDTIEGYVQMPISATAAKLVVDCGGNGCHMNYFRVYILPMPYRVVEQRTKDVTTSTGSSEHHIVTRYRYDEPASNTTNNSNLGAQPFYPKYGEYRGNAVSEVETWAESNYSYSRYPATSTPVPVTENSGTRSESAVMTWFYQTDALKGKPAVVLQRAEKGDPGMAMHDTFESFDETVWNTPESGMAFMTGRIDGDFALRLESSASIERSISRTDRFGNIQNKESILVSFRINDQFGSKLYLQSTADPASRFGLCVTASAQPAIALYETNNAICPTDRILIAPGVAQIGRWYSVLIMMDAEQPRVWVWSQDDPSVQAFQTGSGGKGGAWRFVASTAGILDIDNYSEGQIFSMVRYEYGSTQTAVSTIPRETVTMGNYTGIGIYWAYQTAESRYAFDGGKFTATRQEYKYDPSDQVKQDGTTIAQYGETTKTIEKEWDGAGWKPFRLTHTRFRANDNATTKYLVVPVRQATYQCPDGSDPCELNAIRPEYLIGETLSLYDGQTIQYDQSPNSPLRSGSRKLMAIDPVTGEKYYSDSKIVYDTIYKMIKQVTNYQSYGTSASFGNGIEETEETCNTGWFVVDENSLDHHLLEDGSGNYFCTDDGSGYLEYPKAKADASGHQIAWTYDYATGKPITETTPNGAITTGRYDSFGRLIDIVRPGDTPESPSIHIQYNDAHPAVGAPPSLNGLTVDLFQKIDTQTTYQLRKFYSSAGLQLQTQVVNAQFAVGTCQNQIGSHDVCNIVTDVAYDALGRKVRVSVPHTILPSLGAAYQDWSAGQASQETVYDPSGRVAQVINQDGSAVTSVYNILDNLQVASVTNAKGQTTTSYKDARGRLLRTTSPATTTYPINETKSLESVFEYNALDQLNKATVNGLVSEMAYNLAGQKTWMRDPDLGEWNYAYNALGNLTSQTDARSCTTSLSYDSLNRVTTKSFSGGCSQAQVHYSYDESLNGIGQRTGMTDQTGQTRWDFDIRGRMVIETKTVSGVGTFSTSFDYNSADLVTAITYPGGLNGETSERIVHAYLPQKVLAQVTGSNNLYLLDEVQIDQFLNVSKRTFGNGLFSTAYQHYPWKAGSGYPLDGNGNNRLFKVTVTKLADATQLQDFQYQYDQAGNITQINLATTNGSETQQYTYDELDRLVYANVPGSGSNSFTETYGYNAIGNLAAKATTKDNVTTTNVYDYGGLTADHPHAVKSAGTSLYGYDANGNMTSRQVGAETFQLTYDAENRLVLVTSPGRETIRYLYDGDGKLARRIEGSKNTIYIGKYAEYAYDGDPSTTTTPTATPVTQSATPTVTLTPTPFGTKTVYPTLASTFTPTAGPTPTRTPTQVLATATATGTKVPYTTPTPNQTWTKTLTPSKTPTRTPTPARSITPTPTGPTSTFTATPAQPTSTPTPAQWPTLAPTPNPVNILPNGNFETGVTPWQGLTQTNLTTNAHSGNQAVRITSEWANFGWLDVIPGQPYTLKAWYKWTSFGNTDWGFDRIQVYNYDWSEAISLGQFHTIYPANTWTEITLTFTPRTDKIWVYFGLFGPQSNVEMFFDDLSLTTLAAPPPAGSPKWTYYYYAGSERIAMRVRDASSDKLYYLINDHLSSTSQTIDQNGNTYAEIRYYPFGGTRYLTPNDMPTNLRYTGQRQEIDTGLYWMNSRWYDGALGRWVQPDTIVPESQGVQAWDRYAFVNNNPVRWNDPTGHCIPLCSAIIGGVIGGIVGGATYALTNQGSNFNGWEMAAAIGVGAGAGALVGSGIGVLAGATVTTAAATTAVSTISAGTSAFATGELYMANNQNKFETGQFIAQTGIAGTTAYFSGNPTASLPAKIGINVAGAEASYLASSNSPNMKGMLSVGLASAMGTGVSDAISKTAPEFFRSGSIQVAPRNALSSVQETLKNERIQYAVFNTYDGIFSGATTTTLNSYAQYLADEKQ